MYMSRLAAQKEWAFMKVSVDGLGPMFPTWRRRELTNEYYNLDTPRTPVPRPTTDRSSTTLHPHGGY